MAKPLATGNLVKKKDKSAARWKPSGVFDGYTRPLPKKAY